MSRNKFNLLDNFEKKILLKSKCESFSKDVFIENKHLEILIEKCLSNKNNFSLDMPGPIIFKADKEQVSIKLINE